MAHEGFKEEENLNNLDPEESDKESNDDKWIKSDDKEKTEIEVVNVCQGRRQTRRGVWRCTGTSTCTKSSGMATRKRWRKRLKKCDFQGLFVKGNQHPQHLHYPLRRQRQMYRRDSRDTETHRHTDTQTQTQTQSCL